MTKTINKISDTIIEVVETKEITTVMNYRKQSLQEEKINLEKRITEIDLLLTNF